MNYIFFNNDGSIKKTNFTDSIQQNDDGSNSIFVSVDGLDFSSYTAVGVFVLPDGTVSEEGADFESDYEYASGETADGFLITLTLNETKLAGVVFLTLQIIEDATNKAKYTYRVAITINESASLSSITLINLAQYNALKEYIDTNFLKEADLSHYVTYTDATADVDLGNYSIHAADILLEKDSSLGAHIKVCSGTSLQGTAYAELYVDDNYYPESYLKLSGSYGVVRFGTQGIHFGSYILSYPLIAQNETIATTSQLSQKGLIASFNTNSFAKQGTDNFYSISDVAVSNFITGADLLIITWGGCFAICPIPASGPGRVAAALWNSNGESQVVRIKYELKDGNTKLDISLDGSFTPPTNYTVYVQCIKL